MSSLSANSFLRRHKALKERSEDQELTYMRSGLTMEGARTQEKIFSPPFSSFGTVPYTFAAEVSRKNHGIFVILVRDKDATHMYM